MHGHAHTLTFTSMPVKIYVCYVMSISIDTHTHTPGSMCTVFIAIISSHFDLIAESTNQSLPAPGASISTVINCAQRDLINYSVSDTSTPHQSTVLIIV